ncbi:MAG: FUSC family protein, partial [Brachybacterium sp.]|nr:FUSC family protein [Brachybacterium sp.]
GRFALAAAVAGMLGLASGLPFPYWAQIAAIAPLSAPGRTLQVERGLHRIIGTTLGIVTTAFLLSFPAQPWQLVVWVVVLQFLAEMYVLRNYSFALLFITPLALLMVQIAHPQPIGAMLEARVLETAIGAVVGIAGVSAGARWSGGAGGRRLAADEVEDAAGR